MSGHVERCVELGLDERVLARGGRRLRKEPRWSTNKRRSKVSITAEKHIPPSIITRISRHGCNKKSIVLSSATWQGF
jgi:hypothetical protein